MNDRRVLATLFVVLALAAAPLGAAAVPGLPGGSAADTQQSTPTEGGAANDSNVSLGASVSAFMQASAAGAKGEVDRGMFGARFNSSNADTRDSLVRQRTAVLERRVEQLRAQRDDLMNNSDGKITPAERAKAARLQTRIESLQAAINQTETAADRANVQLNRTKLEELRRSASTLSGPDVAALATDLVDRERGSQGDRGPANRSNATNATNASDPGPPGDTGAGTGDGNSSSGDGTSGDSTETETKDGS